MNTTKSKIAIVGAIAIAVLATPMLVHLHTIKKSHQEWQDSNECIDNLRYIDSAKQQWTLENHKQDTDTPTMDDLRPYLRNHGLPVCPEGGVYTAGQVNVKPTCSFPGHIMP